MLALRTVHAIRLPVIGLSATAAFALLLGPIAHGRESTWQQQANERIEDIRQRNAQVRVLDEQGQPIPAVEVDVKQTAKAFPFGAAISPTVLRDPKYQAFFLSHFNWAVFENEMKWYSNEGHRGREDYSRADAMFAWCNEHEIPVRGHCIFWEPEQWQPRWLRGLGKDELRAAVEQRVTSVATRYRDKIGDWDVDNEMLHGSFFKDNLGDEIHAWMFKRAHEIDPKARLFVNDFNILSVDQNFTEPQVDEYIKQIRQLIDEGAPIHGVGIQGHIWFNDAVDHPEALRKNLDKLAELGLPIWITEFDTAFDDETVNANGLEAVYRTAYGHPAVEGVIMWVFWAGNSWRGPNAGLARRDWNLNAAGERYEALMAEWSTEASGVTDGDGVFAFRGFHGEYTVTVGGDSQPTTQKEFRLAPGEETFVIPVRAKPPGSSETVRRTLKEAVGGRFKIGVGVGHEVLQNPEDAALIKQHFEILTPENCMKPQGIHPAEDEWNYDATDRFADFARANQLEVAGHCLVWAKDDRTEPWMMQEDGKPVSRETMLRRIKLHVETVVQRYADVVTMWDVVNEAIRDGDDDLLRDSIYSRTTGMDFIVTAFQAARAKDPDALLIYNDYNCHKPGKREKLIELLTQLKKAGCPVDAYGMQGHFELGDQSIPQLRETFNELRKLGIKVVVSELDIDVVTRGRWWADGGKYREELESYDPYRHGLPEEIQEKQAKQYVEIFKLFGENRDIIVRVSFWNLHDGQSWLNDFPWHRVNYPLLFDRDRNPKPVFDAVFESLQARP